MHETVVVERPAPAAAAPTAPPTGVERLVRAASRPTPALSAAVLRIAVGLVGVLSAARIVRYGWIDQLYAGPSHRFTYLGFGWVPQPSHAVMAGIVAAMAGAAAALALGWQTRVAGAVLLVAFGWTELIDVTTYLNHYWFLTLVLALGLVLPWSSALSLDARRRGGPRPIARVWIWALRFQVGIVYASAGLAKLQADWLLRAEPLRMWLPPRADLPLVGWALDEVATAHLLAVAGAVFDCTIVPLLLWRRTRPWAWVVLVVFHVSTWLLFPIGVFPWLMIGASTVFFVPDWPARLLARASGWRPTAPEPVLARGVATTRARAGVGAWVWGVVAVAWVAVQLALPLRHLAYAGDHRWSDQGYRFAWNVLLVERAGSVTFLVHDPVTGRTRATDGSALYTRAQIQVMATSPDLVHQAALALAADEEARTGQRPEVRVDAWMSLNGRPPARLIDPTVDLAAQPRDLWDDTWIEPRPR